MAVVSRLATPLINARKFGNLGDDDNEHYALQITQRIRDELTEKISTASEN
jgi:hypothetical protein